MPELKLAKLPDRTPVKITITVPPELNQALRQYAGVYRATYGETEAVADLIPFMLASFLEGDRSFAKALKDGMLDATSILSTRQTQPGCRSRMASSSITSTET